MIPNYLKEYRSGETKIVEIDTHKVKYNGKAYHRLDGYEKKKLDNKEYLLAQNRDKVPTKITYR